MILTPRLELYTGAALLTSQTNSQVTVEDRDAATRLAVKQAREDLLAFIMLMNPSFNVGPHHRLLCDELMNLERGKTDRLMVFVSPRSSK